VGLKKRRKMYEIKSEKRTKIGESTRQGGGDVRLYRLSLY
jgi:hypothetical protein